MSDNKQKIIHDIYFDPAGFGSRAVTLADSRKKDKSISKTDVDEFFKKMLK